MVTATTMTDKSSAGSEANIKSELDAGHHDTQNHGGIHDEKTLPRATSDSADTVAGVDDEDDNEKRWWTEEEDRRVLRKLDIHIVPWLFVTYLLAFLDRSNIGNAKTAGMTTDLHIGNDDFQWLLTIFYISYIVFQFLLICYKFIRPSLFMGICVFVWGFAAILQAAAFNWSGLMAARWFIGMSEAGYGTGVALYLSFFYPRHEIGTRFAWFVVGSAVASAIAGSVAYGIQSARDHVSIEVWRLIFIVEAAPTLIVGVALFFCLPDSISSARFLAPHGRRIAEARLYRFTIDKQQHHEGDATNTSSAAAAAGLPLRRRVLVALKAHFDVRNGLDAVRDPASYFNAALLFLYNVGFSSIPVYLPTILSQMGYTALRAQGFSAPPYAVSFVLAVAVTWLSDKTRTRGVYLLFATTLGVVGYFMLATLSDNGTRYGAVWLVVLGLFPSIPLLYSYLLVNSNGESKRGIALIMFGTVGQCGPVLGTRLFPDYEGPYYRKGMYVSAGLLLGAMAIICSSMAYFYALNKRKDAQWAEAERLHHEQQQRQEESSHRNGGDDGKVLSSHAKAVESRPLQFARKFDKRSSEGQQEIHLRRLDISRNRERSIYFYYNL